MTPPISIIIPCYNGVRAIPLLTENLSEIPPERAEFIFVDDGSTDGSSEEMQRRLPTAIRIRQKNQGVAAARNTGAAKAGGTYLLFLDCDDWLDTRTLQERLTVAVENKADVVTADWRMEIRDGDSRKLEPTQSMKIPENLSAALLAGTFWGPLHAYLVRREAYQAVGGSDPLLVNAQDFDLWIRLSINGCKFAHAPVLAGHYVRETGKTSLARGSRSIYWRDTQRVVDKVVSILREREELDKSLAQAAALRLHSVARSVYSLDREWFRRVCGEIRKLDPSFQPPGTLIYRLAARTLGLEAAEKLALLTRGTRK